MNIDFTLLTISTLFFIVGHFAVSSTPLRGIIVNKIGENNYLGVFSLVALTTLSAMFYFYFQLPHAQFIWFPKLEWRWLPLILLPFSFIFAIAGLTIKNPTNLGMEESVNNENTVQGILRITRHPVQWSTILWAFPHIIVNGDLASIVFFGGILFLSSVGTVLIDIKLAKQLGDQWQSFANKTSNVPFLAIIQGRNQLVLKEIAIWKILAGLACYGIILHFHLSFFGVVPYPF